MNRFEDLFESEVVEVVETPEDKQFLGKAKIKWGKSDEWNKNRRFYADKIVTPAIEAFDNESQKGVGIVGQLDHPVGTAATLLANASHLITKAWKDDSKVWWAETRIMRTSKGRDLLAVLKTGTTIGASLRAFGETDKEGKVKPGLEIRAIDFVSSPSFGASASVDKSNVFESYVPEPKEEKEVDTRPILKELDTLDDEEVKQIQVLLEADHVDFTPEQIRALPIYIKHFKNEPGIAPFQEWFRQQVALFASGGKPGITEEERVRRSINEEKRMAADYGKPRRPDLVNRQKEIDELLKTHTRYDAKTTSRLYAEFLEAGGKGSKVDFIKKFGLRSKL